MKKLIKNASSIITVNSDGKGFKRGSELNDIGILENHSLLIEDGIIKDIVPSSESVIVDEVIDVKDKIVLPGLIESHTHLVFAGSRANEFVMKLKGSTYEEISLAGGGIMNTVQAVRKSGIKELSDIAQLRIDNFISQGVTALEIKSGYGLDLENEVKMLETIKLLDQNNPIDIFPTFLGAHTFPPEFKFNRSKYMECLLEDMLPYIAREKLAVFCDGFCETTAFTPEEIDVLFTKAAESGLLLKLHTDQFNSIGGIDTAVKHNAVSVDHLEVLPEDCFEQIAGSDTVCTLLPGVSFFLNYRFAPARKLIEHNAIVSLATDYNPGSSNINNVFFIMSLAAIKMGMSVPEIISAYTINAAKALNISSKTGSIEIGKSADFAVFNTTDYNELVYNIGQNLNYMTIKNGNIIYTKKEKI
jgi:imidazolonepropionase